MFLFFEFSLLQSYGTNRAITKFMGLKLFANISANKLIINMMKMQFSPIFQLADYQRVTSHLKTTK